MIQLRQKEKEIIRMKAEGLTVLEMASKLSTSKRYADQIIHDLYEKTGCKNSAALIRWAFENGHLEINAQSLPSEVKKTG